MRTWLRRWWWLVAVVAVAAAVATVVVVVADGGPDVGPLERVLDVEPPGGREESTGFGALVDEESPDTAYVARSVRGQVRVEAHRAGRDVPLWTSDVDGSASGVELAKVDGTLLVMSTCSTGCAPLVGMDAGSGKRLWTADVPVSEVMGHASGYVALRLTDGTYVTGAAAVELRSGRVRWRKENARDRFELVPERERVAHYAAEGRLRLLDLGTGEELARTEVPPSPEGGAVELSASADEVVLQVVPQVGPVISTVHDAEDLTELWSHDGRVYSLAPGRLAADFGDHARVVDAAGRQRWRADTSPFRGVYGGSWVVTIDAETSTGGERVTYVELATGRQVAEDDHDLVFREPDGVLQANSEFAESDVQFWYLALPSGERAELGTLDVYAPSCAYGHTHIACLDSEGRFGMWRYR